MILAILDNNNSDFALEIESKDLDEAIRCADKGLCAWYCATHPEDWEDDEDFTREEVESFYDFGYAEPTELLLKKAGIKYKLLDVEFTPDGDAIADTILWL